MTGLPKKSYLICTTPRSGSTLLCELLTATGIAGRPDEYFQQLRSTGAPMTPRDYLDGVAADVVPPVEQHEDELADRFLYDPGRFPDFEGYLDWVVDRSTTPNGVFAAKIMWPYMAGLVAGLSSVPWLRGIEGPDALLSRAFPGMRYVWLRRLDKVRQAVSLWKAIQTWRWRQDAAQNGGPACAAKLRYSFEAIDHLRRRLVSSDRAWEIYFEQTESNPLTLTYEDFVPDIDATVNRLLDHVGIRRPTGAGCAPPPTARQADELSEQWVAEFRADFKGRVPAVR